MSGEAEVLIQSQGDWLCNAYTALSEAQQLQV